MEWFYSNSDQQNGPVSEVEIGRLIANKKIDEGTLVWNATLPEWQKINESSLSPLLKSRYAPPKDGAREIIPPNLPWEKVAPSFNPSPSHTKSSPNSSGGIAVTAPTGSPKLVNEEQSQDACANQIAFYILIIPAIFISSLLINAILDIGFACTRTTGYETLVHPIWLEQNAITSDKITMYFAIIPWAFKYFNEYPLHVLLGLLAAWKWPISIIQGFVLVNKWSKK